MQTPTPIRAATPADLAAVWAIDREVFGAEAYPHFFFRQAYDLWGELLRVAPLPSGGLAGYVMGALSAQAHEGWVLSAAVRPACRGRGLATQLTSGLLETLAARGARSVLLTVHPGNAGALGLYAKLGFRVERQEADYFGPGEPRLVLRLAVAPRP
jgi:ribosomal protein S18 acetylase RimI-like enzyme